MTPSAAFGVESVAPAVKRWIKAGSPSRGPLRWAAPDEALTRVVECRALASAAPEGPLPAVLLAEVQGVPLYLVLTSAQVISLHHDATLYEVASDLASHCKTTTAFADTLAERGAAFKLDALRSLAEAIADWPSLVPPGMPEARRIRRIAEGLGMPLKKLAALREGNPTAVEFLGLDSLVLGDLVAAEKKLARVAKPAGKVDLSNCWLESLPEGLIGSRVRELDLSGNPDLPWATLGTPLSRLPELKVLRAAGNDLGDGVALRAALPGVRVELESGGPLATLAAAARKPAGVRELSLESAGLRKLPETVSALTDLEVLDLSHNPKLDWDDACTRLAKLPRLREVRVQFCDLDAPPPGLERIRTLEVLDFRDDGPVFEHSNTFHDSKPKGVLLRALPALRRVDLGAFPASCASILAGAETDPATVDLPVLEQLEEVSCEAENAGSQSLANVLSWLARLPALRTLRLHANAEDLRGLAGARALRELRLRGRCARALPTLLPALPQLEALSFVWHELRVEDSEEPIGLPPAIRGLTGLRDLELQWGSVGYSYDARTGDLPDWLAELPLERLALHMPNHSGPTNALEAACRLTALRALELTFSKYGARPTVGPEVAVLTRLERLELRLQRGTIARQTRLPPTLQELSVDTPVPHLAELVNLRSAELLAQLDAEGAAALAGMTALETLRVQLTDDATLPATLVRLRELHVSGGSVPDLPALERLETWREIRFPERLPSVREIQASPGDAWERDIERWLGYPLLRRLVVHNFWPKKPSVPDALARLRQVDEIRFLNTAIGRDPKLRERVCKLLPDCRITWK